MESVKCYDTKLAKNNNTVLAKYNIESTKSNNIYLANMTIQS